MERSLHGYRSKLLPQKSHFTSGRKGTRQNTSPKNGTKAIGGIPPYISQINYLSSSFLRKMKHTSFSTIFSPYLAISLILFIPPIQSTHSHTSLLEQICRQSPHYHLCIMTLRSSINHRSKEDIVGFARLTLEMLMPLSHFNTFKRVTYKQGTHNKKGLWKIVLLHIT